MNEQIRTSPRKIKSKKKRRMFDFIVHAVDKVFYQVYDGEPLRGRRRSGSASILEEEVLFCKNNVCVHVLTKTDSSDLMDEKHLPGYMCIKKIYKADFEVSDLILSWVPNKLLTINSAEDVDILSDNSTENEQVTATNNSPTDNKVTATNNSPTDNKVTATNSSPTDNKVTATNNSPTDNKVTVSNKTSSSSLVDQNISELDLPNGGDVFSINLLDMKTVKLFYSGVEKDAGQFVIGSHENEYKVFHFHNTGLLKLTEIFTTWNGCTIDADLIADEVGQEVFYINSSEASAGDYRDGVYPEEGRYKAMNMNVWHGFVNQVGQIEDGYNFRKHVFFGGLSQEVRPDAWKYLMYYYPMHSTYKDRDIMKDEKRKSYELLHEKRLSLSGDDYETFWRKVQFTVDKDVVRTDRSHPYYAGQDNPNIQKMRSILLNYAIHNPQMGYTQGMSDLVAPVLATLHDEVDSFWCFVGLMEASMFATTPTDDSMDKSLNFLRELLRIILPEFYMHCLCQDYDLDLLFAHRWLVLCFKREFIFHEVLKIWEACWARYQTDYFHIFLCVAVVSLYGEVCLEKKMDSDEILQYFTDMATKFDGSAVLKEGRAILYKFRQLNRIPCSLRGLLSGKGVWDGGIAPEVECVSHHQRCCFEYRKNSSSDVKDSAKEENTSIKENSEMSSSNEMSSSDNKETLRNKNSIEIYNDIPIENNEDTNISSNEKLNNFEVTNENSNTFEVTNDNSSKVTNENSNTFEVTNENSNTFKVTNENSNTFKVTNDNSNNIEVANENLNNFEVTNDNSNNIEVANENPPKSPLPLKQLTTEVLIKADENITAVNKESTEKQGQTNDIETFSSTPNMEDI